MVLCFGEFFLCRRNATLSLNCLSQRVHIAALFVDETFELSVLDAEGDGTTYKSITWSFLGAQETCLMLSLDALLSSDNACVARLC